jgi:hypothetical protein
MRRSFNRLAKQSCGSETRAIFETLEDRRLLSASPGMTLHRVAHLSTVQGQPLDSIEVATVSGPAIAALNTNYAEAGPDSGLGGSLDNGQFVANVQWGTGKSAVHLDGSFTTTGRQDTLTISSNNYLVAGHYPLRVTLIENGTTLATLTERVTILPRTTNGLALHAVAGKPFTGTVGFITSTLQSDQTLNIDWGDRTNDPSSVQTVSESNGKIAVEASHTYATPGKYIITVYLVTLGTPHGAADEITRELVSAITVSRR